MLRKNYGCVRVDFTQPFSLKVRKPSHLSHSINLSCTFQMCFSPHFYYSVGVSWHAAKSKSACSADSRADPHPNHHRCSVQTSHMLLIFCYLFKLIHSSYGERCVSYTGQMRLCLIEKKKNTRIPESCLTSPGEGRSSLTWPSTFSSVRVLKKLAVSREQMADGFQGLLEVAQSFLWWCVLS